MKCLKLEIERVDDTKRWYALMSRCQQLTNRTWQLWLLHHIQGNSPDAIRTFLDALAAWRKDKKGDKPKLAIQCFPKELANSLYHDARKNFPDLNVRTVTLLLNIIRGRVVNRKAAKGSLSGWMAILLGNENIPSATRPVPVPFDKANSKVWNDKGIKVKVRAIREENENGRGQSIESTFGLVTTGRASRYAEPIHQVAAGESTLKGCSIMYDQHRRKWYALVSYEPPAKEQAKVNPELCLFVKPCRGRPFRVRVLGRSFYFGGDGVQIRHRRERVIQSRWNRQENYRWTATSTKGHGLTRALDGFFKLKQSWNFFAKTYNQQFAAKLVLLAAEKGAGRIVFLDRHTDRAFLATAGKQEDRREATAWPWYQLEKLIRDAAHPVGIEVVTAGRVEGAAV